MTHKKKKKILLVAGALLILAPMSPVLCSKPETSSGFAKHPASITDGEARAFVMETGNEIIRILVKKDDPLSNRKDNFRNLLRKDFNIPAIGKFVLGRHWKAATKDQRRDYLLLFEDAIVDSYSAQFDNYSNERLEIFSSRSNNREGLLVQTRVIRPSGGEPLNVDWQVFKTRDGSLKIYDIIVNGVSMSITQRNEYARILQSTGGDIQGLLDNMKGKAVSNIKPN